MIHLPPALLLLLIIAPAGMLSSNFKFCNVISLLEPTRLTLNE